MNRPWLKRSFLLLSLLWVALGLIVYVFFPAILTGNRVIDAVLLSALATVLLGELFEVIVGLLRMVVRQEKV